MNKMLSIPVEKIKPNPFQPRQVFDEGDLQELAASIKTYGVLQPLLVVQQGEDYLLIAGERRLRASRLAGLKEVPCVLGEYSDREKAEIALIENLQRANLHFLEEAEGMEKLLADFSLTQEELAERLGKSQSAIANKLRVLKLSPELKKELIEANLSERHARALLKVEEGKRRKVLRHIIAAKLNVQQTDAYVAKLTAPKEPTHRSIVVSDVRIYLNSFKQLVNTMNKGGIKAGMDYKIENGQVVVTVKIDNKKRR